MSPTLTSPFLFRALDFVLRLSGGGCEIPAGKGAPKAMHEEQVQAGGEPIYHDLGAWKNECPGLESGFSM